MAKQLGEVKVEGRIEHLVFYKMRGEYYVRMKSSLTGKRFWKERAFEGSRRSALLLARASSLASRFYRTLSKEKRAKGLFNEITGRVTLLLKQGKEEEEVLELLQQQYCAVEKKEAGNKSRSRKTKRRIVLKKERLFTVPVCSLLFYQNIAVHKRKKRYCWKE
jgi:hypothetical protein